MQVNFDQNLIELSSIWCDIIVNFLIDDDQALHIKQYIAQFYIAFKHKRCALIQMMASYCLIDTI